MLFFLLSGHIRFPLLGYILNGFYYMAIGAGLLTCVYLIRRRLVSLGYPSGKIRAFILIGAALAVPTGYIGSRAANMFYHPPGLWSFSFFMEQFAEARMQTFHGAILLPAVFLSLLIILLRLDFGRVWDVICLYIPLGHAFGRTGCFLAGCCWGRTVQVCGVSFHNPVPLYAIVLNLLLFLFLKLRFETIYYGGKPAEHNGLIAALYLTGYGGIRFVLEMVRKENTVAMGLTQAQFVSAGFMAAGLLLIVVISLLKTSRRPLPVNRPEIWS